MSTEQVVLLRNIREQMDRLLKQLAELEEFKSELSPEEYTSSKEDTREQLDEFTQSLQRFSTGDITLLDEVQEMKIAIQAAISEAFKTPEVIALFAKKQPVAIRYKLVELHRDHQSGKVSDTRFNSQKLEMLLALRKLNDTLTTDELEYLDRQLTDVMANFETASNELLSSEQVVAAASKKNHS